MNKTAVKNFAVSARIFLKNAVMQKALACGISENGELITKNECISDEKNQLIQKIQKDGFFQIIEETAYFWFHRLMALRFMEVNHYFSEKLFVLGQQNEYLILEQCRKLYDNLPEMFDMLENWRVLLFPDNLCSSGGLIRCAVAGEACRAAPEMAPCGEGHAARCLRLAPGGGAK